MTEAAGEREPRDLHWRWYLLALLLYIAMALASLSLRDNVLLLNWIIGPLFPLVVLYLVPTWGRRLARAARHR
ncbi:MAG: hypothetical protein H0X61_14575 [Acidimicrobiia bacterium]|jgi:hypothetical protein|nr:hypothetical protein [Acidimicrobiia bacterium]